MTAFSTAKSASPLSQPSQLAYLSLGSNVGDRPALLFDALERLKSLGEVRAVSSLYETEPVEFTAQPFFLNCAATLATQLPPADLMSSLLGVELQMGRRRGLDKGPRLIDLDILLFDNQVISTDQLRIPHPAMHQRRFVLEPLAEIAPWVLHPLFHKTIAELRDALPPGQEVRKISAATIECS